MDPRLEAHPFIQHQWIRARVDDLGLSLKQKFVKKEATAEEVTLLVKMLWHRAADIPCEPRARIAFHNMLLLSGIGGFRSGVLFNMKFHQVGLDLVLHPATGERQLVTTFTIYQNKQQTKTI